MPKNYVELGDLDSALMYLNMAIKIDPSFAGYHYNKATILHAFGDTRAAITELNNYFAHPNSDKTLRLTTSVLTTSLRSKTSLEHSLM